VIAFTVKKHDYRRAIGHFPAAPAMAEEAEVQTASV